MQKQYTNANEINETNNLIRYSWATFFDDRFILWQNNLYTYTNLLLLQIFCSLTPTKGNHFEGNFEIEKDSISTIWSNLNCKIKAKFSYFLIKFFYIVYFWFDKCMPIFNIIYSTPGRDQTFSSFCEILFISQRSSDIIWLRKKCSSTMITYRLTPPSSLRTIWLRLRTATPFIQI